MKKLFAIFVIVFLFSAVSVFAQDRNTDADTAPDDRVPIDDGGLEVECITEQDCIDSGKCDAGLECSCVDTVCHTGLVADTDDSDADDDLDDNLEEDSIDVRDTRDDDRDKRGKGRTQKVDRPLAAHIQRCRAFVTDNQLSDNAPALCERFDQNRETCLDFLIERGFEDADARCREIASNRGRGSANSGNDRSDRARAVLAHNALKIENFRTNHPRAADFLSDLSDERKAILTQLPRAEASKILRLDRDKAIEKLDKLRIKRIKKEDLYRKRELAKDRVDAIKRNLDEAKERFDRARDLYKDRRDKFTEARDRLRTCEGDQCSDLRDQAREHAKNVVIHSADRLIGYLNKIKHRVESAEDLDEDRAAEILAELDSFIGTLEDAKAKAEAATTKEELQEAASEVRDIWKRVKHLARLHAAHVTDGRIWSLIRRSEHLEDRLDNALSDLVDKGVDVSSLEEKVAAFSDNVAEAKAQYQEAHDLLRQARELRESDGDGIRDLVEQAKQLLRDANENLKEAHTLLREIVREIKAAGSDIPEEEDEVEVIELEDGE